MGILAAPQFVVWQFQRITAGELSRANARFPRRSIRAGRSTARRVSSGAATQVESRIRSRSMIDHTLRSAMIALCCTLFPLAAFAQDSGVGPPFSPPADEPETIKLTLHPQPEAQPAMRYALLPPLLER